jgi:hypothetical protein
MSTARFDTLSNAAGTSTVPVNTVVNGSAKAWVNFDGTTSPGTIRASFNVSSITDNGTGDYTVNFTTAMPDANYAAMFTGGDVANLIYGSLAIVAAPQTTTAARFQTRNGISPLLDATFVNVAIFR